MAERPRLLALFGSAVLFGQERGNIEALAALKSQGCEVLCLVRDEPWSVHIPPALDARGLRWTRVPYIEHRLPGRLQYIILRNPIAFLRANQRFVRILRDFRPTHVYAFNQVYVLNFLIALWISRLPIIFRAGDEPTTHNWFWRAVWKFVAARTHKFVANSFFVSAALRMHGISEDRITVIYNAPPHRIPSSSPFSLAAENEAKWRVSFVGQISEHKGVHVLVDAFRSVVRKHPNTELVIAGRISDWIGDSWARRLRDDTLKDPELAGRVLFVGEIADVPGLLALTDVHVAPSLFNDPSPNVVMEAKRAGRPSIVFPRGGMPELVADGVEGIVCCQASAKDLSDALILYLENPELARRHGRAALSSLSRLGVHQFAQRWVEVCVGPRTAVQS